MEMTRNEKEKLLSFARRAACYLMLAPDGQAIFEHDVPDVDVEEASEWLWSHELQIVEKRQQRSA
jgi:hypothetical protein